MALLASTFVTVFLAELGDKTQIATLLLSAQSGRPWLVFAGSAAALVATGLIVMVELRDFNPDEGVPDDREQTTDRRAICEERRR
jgi:hypothetical protein